MKRWHKWSFNVLTVTVSVTGVAYFVMKYLMASRDPFSLVNHPLQPWMLDLHILAAPLLILIVGIIVSAHVEKSNGNGTPFTRRSGQLSLICLIPMLLSGYLLQILTGELARRVALIVHLVTGGLFAAGYLAHLAVTLWRRRMRSGPRKIDRLAA